MAIAPNLSAGFIADLARDLQFLSGKQFSPEQIWTGRKLASFPLATENDVDTIISRAREAQLSWENTPVSKRRRVATRLIKLLHRNEERFMQLSQLFNGKSRIDAHEEFLLAVGALENIKFDLYKAVARRRVRPIVPFLSKVDVEVAPLGLIAAFTLNDMPLSYGCDEVFTPLVAGNSVVQFVPAQSALAAVAIRRLAIACGLPPEVWQIVPAETLDIGMQMVEEFDHVVFIGSTANGSDICSRIQNHFVTSSLFLGTHNQGIVFPDAIMSRAVAGSIRAAFHQTGQGPCHIERLWVHSSIYDQFLQQAAQFVREQVTLGASWTNRCSLGSLYSEGRLKMVQRHVTDAVELGAQLVVGGNHRPDLGPYFFEPTILTNVPREALCYDEETYGPVLSIEKYDDPKAVLREIGSSQYAYHLVVFTGKPEKVRPMLRDSKAGLVSINDPYYILWSTTDAALRGSLETGNGIRHSSESISQYVRETTSGQLYQPFKRWSMVSGVHGDYLEKSSRLIQRAYRKTTARPTMMSLVNYFWNRLA